jgi:polyhydroxyalkanoate synthase
MAANLIERDSYASTALSEIIDRSVHAAISRYTGGLSPLTLASAYLDWGSHLAFSPGKQVQLADKAARKAARWGHYLLRCAANHAPEPCVLPLPNDKRFVHPGWQAWPYNAIHQAFLLGQQWWHSAMTGVRGVSARHEAIAEFTTRQILDYFSPSNFPATNPAVMERTLRSGGANLAEGWRNFLEDYERTANGKRPAAAQRFRPGREVAATPGKVVYRNRLIELIQYSPTTPTVRPEPVLIVPAWIMKYYILDLSAANSLVRFLVGEGFTVFMISWKNPGPEDRDLSFEAYRRLGTRDALAAIGEIVPRTRVHAVGYCIGGTLLAVQAAARGRDHDRRLASVTLFAAQVDFTEAGELMLFVNESQLAFLEDSMWEQGYLDTKQMAGAFGLLRSNDLVWSRLVNEYLMGERAPMSDLMAWNADGTRMPYRMHTEYLHGLFLRNDLAAGRFLADGRPVSLRDIRVPMFVVSTERDHVAPWRSVYKVHSLVPAEICFVLASGGHNAGIVAPPGNGIGHYRVLASDVAGRARDADDWAAKAVHHDGSWWPEWTAWLRRRSGKARKPPPMGTARDPRTLEDAPGAYVRAE